jgi:hypothetical protein
MFWDREKNNRTMNSRRLFRVMLFSFALLPLGNHLVAQSLNDKLSASADFIPSDSAVTEQLIEIAQHYQIPMGIEWFDVADKQAHVSVMPQRSTVIELIKSVVKRTPGYTAEIRNEVVLIKHSSFSDQRLNFLNLRLTQFKADKVNVFGAEWLLRVAINRTLHPEAYASASNGGYGYGHNIDDNFDVENISYTGRDVRVREVLNAIIKQNGNALWIVEFTPSKLMDNEPFFAQRSHGTDVDTRFVWRIVPLSHLSNSVE